MTRPLLVVLSSPSGGGKTTICREMLRRHPDWLYSVSATTRPPRPDEKNGADYIFLNEDEFRKKIEAGAFVEYAEVYNHHYGTLKEMIDRNLKEEKITLFDLDYNGAKNLKRSYSQAVTIFLMPPSLEVLKKRLVSRGTDSPEVQQGRFQEALKEVSLWSNYDYVVTNDELDSVVRKIEAVIVAEGCKVIPEVKPRLLKELEDS